MISLKDSTRDRNKSDEILEIVESKAGQETTQIEEEKIQLVIVSLSGDLYGFYGDFIVEIIQAGNITDVPSTPDYILGLINLRGDIESVFDIKWIFALGENEITKSSSIVIAQVEDLRSGILVDSVEDVFDLAKSKIHLPLPTMDKNKMEYISGETDYQGKNVVILDLTKVFTRMANEA